MLSIRSQKWNVREVITSAWEEHGERDCLMRHAPHAMRPVRSVHQRSARDGILTLVRKLSDLPNLEFWTSTVDSEPPFLHTAYHAALCEPICSSILPHCLPYAVVRDRRRARGSIALVASCRSVDRNPLSSVASKIAYCPSQHHGSQSNGVRFGG